MSSLLTEQQRAQLELEQRKVFELYKADQKQSDISDYQLRLMAATDTMNRAIPNGLPKPIVLVRDTTVQGTRAVGDNNPNLAEKKRKEKKRRRMGIGIGIGLASLLLLLILFLWRKYRTPHPDTDMGQTGDDFHPDFVQGDQDARTINPLFDRGPLQSFDF
eukprot:jgi/Mesvir1/19800/Mv13092-RA.1